MNAVIRQTAAKIALGPLLLAQGRYTRWVTPKLPEPQGTREGETGEGAVLRLLILGDSAAAGVGAEHQSQALTGRLVSVLSEHYRVVWKLKAETGLRSHEVLEMVAQEPAAALDVVVVSVGVNDITSSTSVKQWTTTLAQLIALLSEKFDAPQILLSGVPPMRHFLALPQPLRWFLGLQADLFNQHLADVVEKHPDCNLLAPEFPAIAEYLASDGFHPGPPAYELWANAASSMIRAGGSSHPTRTAAAQPAHHPTETHPHVCT